MADIIEMAREIGRQLQKDELYLKLELARQQSEEDEELQNAIGEFNLKRMAINNEASKADRSDEKMQQLNAEMRHAYAIIMSNENMIAYNEAKAEFDGVVNRVLAIINQSAQGADPETADYTQSSCSGSCETCGGCGA